MPTSVSLCALVALSMVAQLLPAQARGRVRGCAGGAVATVLPGGLSDELARARGLRRDVATAMLRSASDDARAAMLRDSAASPARVAIVLPEILVTSHTGFPVAGNDGPMWAGRGLSYSITGGVAVCGYQGRWGAIVAPTYWYAENANIDLPISSYIVPPLKSEYSIWANPYYYLPRSLDAPRRMGADALRRVEPGVIAFWYRAPRVEVGFTTESEWWGPGQRNALLLSSQAAGVPRVYVRTSRPIPLGGALDVRYFVGAPSYSKFFRAPQPADSGRSLAGIALEWRPRFESGLSLGLARLVASPRNSNAWADHLFDAVSSVGRPNARGRQDSTAVPGRDQLFSLFANWRMPADGGELWVEWAKAELPVSLADFLSAPNHAQALTIGAQKVQQMRRPGWAWRVGAEYSQTNQSSTYRERPLGSWYTSRAVPGGFSNKGQVLGAVIGPGSVTQWIGFDIGTERGSVGAFLQRVKWDDDAFYTIPRPIGNGLCKHDVSLTWGLRGMAATAAGAIDATLGSTNRLNIYWQALGLCFVNEELQIDKRDFSLEFRFHPRTARRAKDRD